MDTLILEDFRCFAGRNEVPIRPLTLLVGENSTGKTSFLAAVPRTRAISYDMRSRGVGSPDFNEEPFNLGSYDQIANYRAGRAGRKEFRGRAAFTVARPRRPETLIATEGVARKTEMQIEGAIHFGQPSDLRVPSSWHPVQARNRGCW